MAGKTKYDPLLGKIRKSDYPADEIAEIHRKIAGKAPLSHNHTGTYAPADHNHDSRYALLNHNHDNVYQPKGNYAAANHEHQGVYQPAGNYLTQHQQLKTINNQSLVGEGNINIEGGGSLTPITDIELDAMLNEVDMNANNITFEIDNVEKTAYRFPNGDIIPNSGNTRKLCFSLINGTKYYVYYNGTNGAWDDTTSTLKTNTKVYSDSNCTTQASTISGGTEGFVVVVTTSTITLIDNTGHNGNEEIEYEPGMTWQDWINSDYNVNSSWYAYVSDPLGTNN